MTNADYHNIYLFLTTIPNWQEKADSDKNDKITANEFCDWIETQGWDTDTLGRKPEKDIIADFFCEMLDINEEGVNNNSLDKNEIEDANNQIALYKNIKRLLDPELTSTETQLKKLLEDTIKDWRKAIYGYICTELIDKGIVNKNTSDDDIKAKIQKILESDNVYQIHGEYIGVAVTKKTQESISWAAAAVGYSLSNDSSINTYIDIAVNKYIDDTPQDKRDLASLQSEIDKAIAAYVETADDENGGQKPCANNLINEIQTARLMSGLLDEVKKSITSTTSDYIAYEGNEKVYLNAIRGFIVNHETLKSNEQYVDNLSKISGYATEFLESDFAKGLKEEKTTVDFTLSSSITTTSGSSVNQNVITSTTVNGDKFKAEDVVFKVESVNDNISATIDANGNIIFTAPTVEVNNSYTLTITPTVGDKEVGTPKTITVYVNKVQGGGDPDPDPNIPEVPEYETNLSDVTAKFKGKDIYKIMAKNTSSVDKIALTDWKKTIDIATAKTSINNMLDELKTTLLGQNFEEARVVWAIGTAKNYYAAVLDSLKDQVSGGKQEITETIIYYDNNGKKLDKENISYHQRSEELQSQTDRDDYAVTPSSSTTSSGIYLCEAWNHDGGRNKGDDNTYKIYVNNYELLQVVQKFLDLFSV